MANVIYGKILPKDVLPETAEVKSKQLIGLSHIVGKNGKLFSKTTSRDMIIGQIRQLINTEPGERVMLPNYGLNLAGYLFENLTPEMVDEIKKKVFNQIDKYATNVEYVDCKVFYKNDEDPFASALTSITIHLYIKEKETNEVIPLEFTI